MAIVMGETPAIQEVVMIRRCLVLCLAVTCLQAAPLQIAKTGKGPGILLIHGLGGNKEVWAATAAELSRDHTVVVWTCPVAAARLVRWWWMGARTSVRWGRHWPRSCEGKAWSPAWSWGIPWEPPSAPSRFSRTPPPSGGWYWPMGSWGPYRQSSWIP